MDEEALLELPLDGLNSPLSGNGRRCEFIALSSVNIVVYKMQRSSLSIRLACNVI